MKTTDVQTKSKPTMDVLTKPVFKQQTRKKMKNADMTADAPSIGVSTRTRRTTSNTKMDTPNTLRKKTDAPNPLTMDALMKKKDAPTTALLPTMEAPTALS